MKKQLIMALSVSCCLFGCSASIVEKAVDPISTNVVIPDGTVGVCVIVDASGSMANSVMGASGVLEPKFIIADRALVALGKRLDNYLNFAPNRNIKASIIVLRNSRATLSKTAILPNNAEEFFSSWVKDYEKDGPDGGTPLGNAIVAGANEILPLKLKSKHIIILSDGESNQGDPPEEVIPYLSKQFTYNGSSLNIHFVAFDVNASIFNGVKQLGATVVGASNEIELNKQLDFILKEKVLLEREE